MWSVYPQHHCKPVSYILYKLREPNAGVKPIAIKIFYHFLSPPKGAVAVEGESEVCV